MATAKECLKYNTVFLSLAEWISSHGKRSERKHKKYMQT